MKTSRFTFLFAALLATTIALPRAGADSITAGEIYEATGVQGGLIVHIGCGNGELTAQLRADERYVVEGLDTDEANVPRAREGLHAKGLYGPVSAHHFDGVHLPYTSNIVNLVVAEHPGKLENNEILRVLAPGGVAYLHRGDSWKKLVKPISEAVDQWTHFLHDASGNAVAKDRVVGSPENLRWVAGPKWCRSHEFPSSVNAVVVDGGRIFMIFDEAPAGVYKGLPQNCKLVARDAANGLLLWKVPMRGWQPEHGTGTGNRWNIHHTIPRRLVVQGDRVYVTLGFLDSPVSVLDAASGEILTEALEGTGGTDEIIVSDGILIAKINEGLSVGATARVGKDSLQGSLTGIDLATGKPLWRKEDTGVLPYALSAQSGRVVYHDLNELICLDPRTGEEKWRTASEIRSTLGAASTLAIDNGVVLYHGNTVSEKEPAKAPGKTGKKKRKKPQPRRYLTAFSLENGNVLWTRPGSGSLAAACTQPTDVFVARGTVWCGNSVNGYDLKTGEVVKTLELQNLISPGHHYRCFRAKATERFLIYPKRGAEFIDLEGENHMRNDWLRAPCFTGVTPANGLFYVPPSQCFCYPGVNVSGFLAMAPAGKPKDSTSIEQTPRLERGPAFGKTPPGGTGAIDPARDWPMYRRDGKRSGSTALELTGNLGKQWEIELACPGSQAVIVGDRLWVAEKDVHRVRCVDSRNGKDVWTFTAGGRIDSAPTLHQGLVLFGCRDGSVYCLRARDGALAWRFRATPGQERLVSFGQLESLWPVQGSVLVQNSVVYFAAGRSSFLDGGITAYALDAKTGELLHQHHLEGPWPDISKDVGTPFAMEGALPDLFVSDGRDLYMQRIKFDAELNRLETTQESSLGELDMGANHLVATGGFLDDTGFDRLYWMYSHRWPGFYFAQQSPKAGQLVVFDDTTTYAVKYFYRRIQWSPAFFPGEHGYLLFADDNDNQPILEDKDKTVTAIDWLPEEAAGDKHRRGGRGVEKGTGYCRQHPAKWQTMIPLRIRAMLLAGDRLFAAGTPDVVDPKDPLAAFEGRADAFLQVFSTEDGSRLASIPLPSEPAFDGLSAAGEKLFLVTKEGKLICYGHSATTKSELADAGR